MCAEAAFFYEALSLQFLGCGMELPLPFSATMNSKNSKTLSSAGIPVCMNCPSRDEQTVARMQGNRGLPILLPDPCAGQDVKRDSRRVQVPRVDRAGRVLGIPHGYFLTACIGQLCLKKRCVRDAGFLLAENRSRVKASHDDQHSERQDAREIIDGTSDQGNLLIRLPAQLKGCLADHTAKIKCSLRFSAPML